MVAIKVICGIIYLVASATANGWNLLRWDNVSEEKPQTQASPSPSGMSWFRGGRSRPDSVRNQSHQDSRTTSTFWEGTYQYVSQSWWVRICVKLFLQVWDNGVHYCGTLCASIGLAAKWSYWLLTGIVSVFLLQLLVWTYTWVLYPVWVHSRALWNYSRGHGTWSDVTRLQGQRPYLPAWKGPSTGEAWTAQYVQREVRGRGANQKPFDLLIADGVAVARLRHGTIRGRTNRHGFLCQCDEVRASSHRYFRNHACRGSQLLRSLVRARSLHRPGGCPSPHQGEHNYPTGSRSRPARVGGPRALGKVCGDHGLLWYALVPVLQKGPISLWQGLVLVSLLPPPFEASFSPERVRPDRGTSA